MQFQQVHSGKRATTLPQGTFQITDAEAEAGARFAVKVFELWGLTDTESCVLLGGIGSRTYARWKKGQIGPMDMDRKMRLSILAGIHKGLKYLFTEKFIVAPENTFSQSKLRYLIFQKYFTNSPFENKLDQLEIRK